MGTRNENTFLGNLKTNIIGHLQEVRNKTDGPDKKGILKNERTAFRQCDHHSKLRLLKCSVFSEVACIAEAWTYSTEVIKEPSHLEFGPTECCLRLARWKE